MQPSLQTMHIIQAGDIIALKVDKGLEQSRVLPLLPVSQLSTLNSQPACTAVHHDPANAGRRFIPLLLGDCALPDTLWRCKVVDIREESEVAFAEVLATGQSETGVMKSLWSPIRSCRAGNSQLKNSKQYETILSLHF